MLTMAARRASRGGARHDTSVQPIVKLCIQKYVNVYMPMIEPAVA